MTLIKQVYSSIKPDINKLLKHEFIFRLESAYYSKDELSVFAEQYYLISQAFNKFLFSACGAIDSEEYRFPLLNNLYEEHGNGNLKKSHREFLKEFMTALGIVNVSNIIPTSNTLANIRGMLNLCSTGETVEILGALGPGCESFTAKQYNIILKGLKKYDFTDEQLIFFTEHIAHDPSHKLDIDEILEKILVSDKDVQSAISGARQAIILETLLWDGILKETEQRRVKHLK